VKGQSETFMKNPCLLIRLITGLGAMLVGQVGGQTFTTLHQFSNYVSDGQNPRGELLFSGNVLYGTTEIGGSSNGGVVFVINTDGTGFTNLHNFSINDGIAPNGGLILSGNTLYGIAERGGNILGYGTMFALKTDGMGFTNLHHFVPGEGTRPRGGLVLSEGTVY